MKILFLSIIILLIIAYFANDKELFSPSVIYCSGFALASFFALLNEKKWGNIDLITYLVICGGLLEFFIITYIVKFIFNITVRQKSTYNIVFQDKSVISRYKLILLLLVQIFNLLIIVYYLRKVTGLSNVIEASHYINQSNNGWIQNQVQLPTIVGVLSAFNNACGLFSEYLIAKNTISKSRKNLIFLFLIILMGMITAILVSGARGGVVYNIIAFAFYLYFVYKTKIKWNNNNGKWLLIIFLGILLMVTLLPWSASLVGRAVTDNTDPIDYISIYIGAEIKNLSLFIQNGFYPVKGAVWGQQTFVGIIGPLSRLFELNIPQYSLDLPFKSINGYSLGNVYTTFYPWLYDFGYSGIFVLTMVMGIISETIYLYAKIQKNNHKHLICILIYGYISSFLFLSFFSNKFYEEVFSKNMLYLVISLFLIELFFKKVKNK